MYYSLGIQAGEKGLSMLDMLKLWQFWLIVAIGVLLFVLPAKADTLYIRAEFCKGDVCQERHLPVPPEVNEVQCIYGAMSTVVQWGLQNLPGWTLKHWRCTRTVRNDA